MCRVCENCQYRKLSFRERPHAAPAISHRGKRRRRPISHRRPDQHVRNTRRRGLPPRALDLRCRCSYGGDQPPSPGSQRTERLPRQSESLTRGLDTSGRRKHGVLLTHLSHLTLRGAARDVREASWRKIHTPPGAHVAARAPRHQP